MEPFRCAFVCELLLIKAHTSVSEPQSSSTCGVDRGVQVERAYHGHTIGALALSPYALPLRALAQAHASAIVCLRCAAFANDAVEGPLRL